MEKLAMLEKHGSPKIRRYFLSGNIKYQEKELEGFNRMLSRIKKGEKPKHTFIRIGTSGILLLESQLNRKYLQNRIAELQRGIKERREMLKKVV